MAKQVIQVEGIIEECLPNTTFKVKIDDPNYPADHIVNCHISGKMRMNYIRIIPGDYVRLELTPYDLTKGRIIYRYKSKQQALEARARRESEENTSAEDAEETSTEE